MAPVAEGAIDESFADCFAELPDPRAHNALHDLTDLLFIALLATLCGATSCSDMALFAMRAWGHSYMYDFEEIDRLFKNVGFVGAHLRDPDIGRPLTAQPGVQARQRILADHGGPQARPVEPPYLQRLPSRPSAAA